MFQQAAQVGANVEGRKALNDLGSEYHGGIKSRRVAQGLLAIIAYEANKEKTYEISRRQCEVTIRVKITTLSC